MNHQVMLPDPSATRALASRLVEALPGRPNGWMLLLQGELGSGKSTFARAMLRDLGVVGTVPSPTYTLVEPYDFAGFSAYHIDLYRIADAEELEFLGWSELEDGFRLVEWPERVPGLEVTADIRISLSYADPGRLATFTSCSERGADAIQRLPGIRSLKQIN